jgi:hypothetical protein
MKDVKDPTQMDADAVFDIRVTACVCQVFTW